ncbi:MAG: hypothetical protein KJ915_05615 [Candidatus Omnitrophica bacterium]|nr:hypothetical protein [Candidatus Omnitrophota bacterium]
MLRQINKINAILFIILGLLLFSLVNYSYADSQKFQTAQAGKNSAKKKLKLLITNVSLDKKAINPVKNEAASIRFRLNKKAQISAKIYNSLDQLVREIKSRDMCKSGYNEIIWDGKDKDGQIVIPDAYVYTLTGYDQKNNELMVFDPADETGGLTLAIREFATDSTRGQITYVLPKAARVRIRIGLKNGGPLLRTLIDFKPQPAGRNNLIWDGFDSSHVFNFLGNENLFINISAFSLAENSIIVDYSQPIISNETKNYSDAEMRIKKETDLPKDMHALHERDKCHEPDFGFQVMYENKKDDIIPIKIRLSDKDKIELIGTRYEIVFFLDNVFIFEEEEGISPLTYQFDTKGINSGKHLLTINLHGFDNHVATRSEEIIIKRE